MTDSHAEQFEEFTTQDGPGPADADRSQLPHPEQAHPAHEAHGGSMAPQLVDDTGQAISEPPPSEAGR